MKIKFSHLKKSFRNSKILVIGDIMLDKYVFGKSERYSPEAPVPIINKFEKLNVLGGASNVALNIKALAENEVTCCGIVGDDQDGKDLINLLVKNNINSDGIFLDSNHITTTKERIYSNEKQVIRIDKEQKRISKKSFSLVLHFIKQTIQSYDIIIISDYNKGTITSALIKEIISINRNHSIPIIVDPKKNDFSVYSGVDLITPNLKELEDATHTTYKKNKDIIDITNAIIKKNNIKNIIITMGKKGMIVTQKESSYYIQGLKVKSPDVIGAGDTVIATIALCLISGMDIIDSAKIANIAASICVSKIGTSIINFDELENKMKT